MIKISANYYQEFDADYALDVPAEGYGGWQKTELEVDPAQIALVVMHAWDVGTFDERPGCWHAVEYIPRAYEISQTVFPPLLAAVREAGLHVFHVVGGGDYYRDCPGYEKAVELAGPDPETPECIPPDPVLKRLRRFKADHVWPGKHNAPDFKKPRGFVPEAKPLDDEGVAENTHQLFALCKDAGVNHLVYAGFAIDWCLLMSPGGMLDMQRRGFLCSALRQAVTAVENKQTARHQIAKEIGLWRVAISFGFVFDVDDFIAALK